MLFVIFVSVFFSVIFNLIIAISTKRSTMCIVCVCRQTFSFCPYERACVCDIWVFIFIGVNMGSPKRLAGWSHGRNETTSILTDSNETWYPRLQ